MMKMMSPRAIDLRPFVDHPLSFVKTLRRPIPEWDPPFVTLHLVPRPLAAAVPPLRFRRHLLLPAFDLGHCPYAAIVVVGGGSG